jgi:hypothetical protein
MFYLLKTALLTAELSQLPQFVFEGGFTVFIC